MTHLAQKIAFLLLLVPSISFADVRELSQAELRTIVSTNGAIQTRRLIAGVENFTQGDVVNVRAFLVEDMVTYRVVVRQAEGHLSSIMVDGKTGYAVQENSAVGRRVKAAAAANGAADVSRDVTPPSSANREGGNGRGSRNASGGRDKDRGNAGNAGGNANDNRGANGNRGGNGNDNRGGNGRGRGRGN